jgi:hypothetical protein
VQDEDIQPITEPIIAPVKTKNFHLQEKKKEFPAVTFNKEYALVARCSFPTSVLPDLSLACWLCGLECFLWCLSGYSGYMLPSPHFSPRSFLVSLLDHPNLMRNVAIAGHLHHGKTALMDLFVQQTHDRKWQTSKEVGLCRI